MRPESPSISSVCTLISHAACSLRRGGEGGVSAGLFTSPEAVIDVQKDEFGLGEWQDHLVWYLDMQSIRSNKQLSTTCSKTAATQNGASLTQSLTCLRLRGAKVKLFLKSTHLQREQRIWVSLFKFT